MQSVGLPHAIKAQVHLQASPCGMYGAQSNVGEGFFSKYGYSPVRIII